MSTYLHSEIRNESEMRKDMALCICRGPAVIVLCIKGLPKNNTADIIIGRSMHCKIPELEKWRGFNMEPYRSIRLL
jgi:hypothetical protein